MEATGLKYNWKNKMNTTAQESSMEKSGMWPILHMERQHLTKTRRHTFAITSMFLQLCRIACNAERCN